MKRTLRDNGLGIVFGLLFLGSLVGQAFSGHADYHNQQVVDGGPTVSLGQYVTSSDFAVDVAENWQSAYLQFFLYLLLTVWLIQRGSPESKPVGAPHVTTDDRLTAAARGRGCHTPARPRALRSR